MKILTIMVYDVIKLIRNKGATVMVFILPIVFMFLFGMAFGGDSGEADIPVAIADLDGSEASGQLIKELEAYENLWIKPMSESELRDQVKHSEVELGFVIPAGFSNTIQNGTAPAVEVVKLPSSSDYPALQSILSTAYSKMRLKNAAQQYMKQRLGDMDLAEGKDKEILDNLAAAVDKQLAAPPLIQVKEAMFEQEAGTGMSSRKDKGTGGTIAMFMMFNVIIGGVGSILEERKNKTWDRLDVTATGKFQIMTGKILGTFAKGWVQVLVMLAFGGLAMGIDWGDSIAATVLLVSVYILSVTGMGVFLSSIVKTHAQLSGLSSVIIVSTSMLAGSFWPIEIAPKIMQQIAQFLPQFWLIKGLRRTMEGDLGLSAVYQPALVLLAMGAAFLLLGVALETYKRNRKSGNRAAEASD